MSRGPAVRKADIDRAVAVLVARGLKVGSIDILPGGGVRVIPLTAPLPTAHADPLDAWEAEQNAKHQNEGA